MKKYAWEIVARHSLIQFKVKYLRISSITGKFVTFKGEVIADDRFENPAVYLFIDGDSIDTADEQRNLRLRKSRLLANEDYPCIEFSAVDGCKQSSGKIWELTGDLQIKEIKHPITLVVSFSTVKQIRRKHTAVFHLFGSIQLSHFGIPFEENSEIDDEVQLNAEILLERKA